MKVGLIIGALLFAVLALLRYFVKCRERRLASDRLYELAQTEQENTDPLVNTVYGDWSDTEYLTRILSDRLGAAGFIAAEERKKIKQKMFLLTTLVGVLSFCFSYHLGLVVSLAVVTGAVYLSVMICLFYLRYLAAEFRRKVLFQLPLTLETLILLVEAGLGILPALEQVVRAELNRVNGDISRLGPVAKILRIVYAMAAHGMPFGQALELVADSVDIKALRHVLLHLDVSSAEGGALSPSLRSLSDHTHTEWKLSVESRVKRLETSVVFPVFLSVMGLMMLTAAVPLVPVLDFFSSLEHTKGITASNSHLAETAQHRLGVR